MKKNKLVSLLTRWEVFLLVLLALMCLVFNLQDAARVASGEARRDVFNVANVVRSMRPYMLYSFMTLGMMLILDWRVALICLGFFILAVLAWRMVSLGSVIAASLLPVFTFVFRMFVDHKADETVWFCTAMSLLIAAILVIKHIPNIKRIAAGTESKLFFGGKK